LWGAALSLDYIQQAAALAQARGVALHLDGARLFNAAVALGVPAEAIAAPFEVVNFCFSKGLGAPVGSIVCGSAAFIQEAKRTRRMLGGGMRQAGVLAAAAWSPSTRWWIASPKTTRTHACWRTG
jgi:threonine aldolase